MMGKYKNAHAFRFDHVGLSKEDFDNRVEECRGRLREYGKSKGLRFPALYIVSSEMYETVVSAFWNNP